MTTFHAVVFDLDDTLYLERDFFFGGFTAVAGELARRGVAQPKDLARLLMDMYLQDREGVLDRAADLFGFPPPWIPELVSVFRRHEPEIRLADEVPDVLRSLRAHSIRLGVVTDGFRDVQRRKISSLGLRPFVDTVVIADDHGRDYWKPHPSSLLRCIRQLGSTPDTTIFVGDNPERDVRGARNAGVAIVRIRRPGAYFSDTPSEGDKADHEILDLTELAPILQHP
jgi:putative hydrolase of the HAD superfamily